MTEEKLDQLTVEEISKFWEKAPEVRLPDNPKTRRILREVCFQDPDTFPLIFSKLRQARTSPGSVLCLFPLLSGKWRSFHFPTAI